MDPSWIGLVPREACSIVVLSCRALLYGSLVIAGASCTRRAPDAPVTQSPGAYGWSESEPAVIPVRVTYVLSALRPSLDSVFPVADSLSQARCKSAAGLVCHQYVYRRDSLRLHADGARLDIGTRIQYKARVGALGSARIAGCGYPPESMRRADLRMSTSLYWRRDWRIGSRDTRFDATLLDQCLVTPLGINATRTLQSIVDRQLAEFVSQTDSIIPLIADMKPLADSLWRSFQEPIPLDSTGSFWLSLNPESAQVTPFTSSGASMATTLVVKAKPVVVAGERPAWRRRSLPALSLSDDHNEFRVPLTVSLQFDALARMAAETLARETARQSVHVNSVLMRGQNDSVIVDLSVSGALTGRLTLISRPRWDSHAKELRLDDLDWTIQSRGRLARVKATLGAPLVGRTIRKATGSGRMPLGEQLERIRSEMLVRLNGSLAPGVIIGTSIREIEVAGIGVAGTSIVVRAYLTGQSGIWIR